MGSSRDSRLAAIAMAVLVAGAAGVDRGNFKTCEQSSFCKRNRAIEPGQSTFSVVPTSLSMTGAYGGSAAEMDVVNSANGAKFVVQVIALTDARVRIRMNEKDGEGKRYEVKEVLPDALPMAEAKISERTDEVAALDMGGGTSVRVRFNPIRIDVYSSGTLALSVNSRGLLNFEHLRAKGENEPEGMWEENFKTHADSKPKGPTSVGFDATFPGAEHVYGIPEHASTMSLKTTKPDTDPYRLYNLDVFEYELDNPMALYGSIPFMLAHTGSLTTGLLFLNSAEMWVDVERVGGDSGILSSLVGGEPTPPSTATHWIAESGIIDVFVLLGPTPKDVFRQYAGLTGFPELPPLFSLAYHQCRWNYNDEADVKDVNDRLDAAEIPTDVIWLDIEHTDGKRYMTWNTAKFPDPKSMQEYVAKTGRKMVNIVDPHIKRVDGYHIHTEATSLGHYIDNKDGNDYDGWCWPGSSSWLDFMEKHVRDWWASQFAYDKYGGTTEHMYFWNDMNEPSVFNGPEVTMHKDAKHLSGWEHRDVHNIYGMWQQAATAQGITERSGGSERPFVLSRAFFAGSQKYGAIWTGDNTADWGHLAASIPMILSVSLAGLPFAGADMGGFFGNPEDELLTRWYQVGAFQPFMRAHAHLDTQRREPYLKEGQYFDTIKASVIARYTWLPYWYTLFFESGRDGMPVMRPLWIEFPSDAKTFALENQFMVGSGLLVVPVTEAGVTSVEAYFAGDQPWYDVETALSHKGGAKAIAAPLRKVPVFQRGGTILPRKMRQRRTSSLMHRDPFTFDVALNTSHEASGSLFIDDYHTYAYRTAKSYIAATMAFTSDGGGYTFKYTVTEGAHSTPEWVERVRIMGIPLRPSAVTGSDGAALEFAYDETKSVLVVKKPFDTVTASASFTISA
eukprot:CAMPEP_0182925880 /NCGR_PEP_ID=MMETSP0105_2-20130417/10710_1 /TAXON_ID=81532 ORGANISM="Acanthoeca-like sp., Strain 10tr" /NCGR_SAMPLE_ID=MMETSP0105_2 /ASSEMBLY_ACC=CAM_ASM_000205 /LENGTH=901 /DNA_ID=CAMNT_0025063749 /DNA_START=26 /DNA_END=2731 /DNA_ORIENTATION=+